MEQNKHIQVSIAAAHLVDQRLQLLPLRLAAQRVKGRQLRVRAAQRLQPPPVRLRRRRRAADAVQQRQLRPGVPAPPSRQVLMRWTEDITTRAPDSPH